jgi:hypothetical protein
MTEKAIAAISEKSDDPQRVTSAGAPQAAPLVEIKEETAPKSTSVTYTFKTRRPPDFNAMSAIALSILAAGFTVWFKLKHPAETPSYDANKNNAKTIVVPPQPEIMQPAPKIEKPITQAYRDSVMLALRYAPHDNKPAAAQTSKYIYR